jgi:hypothetical protein
MMVVAERRTLMRRSRLAAAALAALAVLVTGCGASARLQGSSAGSSGGSPAATLAPPRATCGTTTTAANVPVVVEVEKGSAACAVAMRIQRGYTALVRAGKVAGNGGGAPVTVNGWTCQGQDTPTIVATGEASDCRKGGTEIIAVLNLPSQPASPGASS